MFRLHDSDAWCGSYLTVADAAEILEVSEAALAELSIASPGGERLVSELDLHRAWSGGRVPGAPPAKVGSATRSLDELMLKRLMEITLPGAIVEEQVPFLRRRADLVVTFADKRVIVEFMGPSHFITSYQRPLRSPLERKAAVEDHFGDECVVWPYWIQRCQRNVRALFDHEQAGLASVWSTRAMFGDFLFEDAAQMIERVTRRFNAIYPDGLGYMYTDERVHKPVHPIVARIRAGRERTQRLVPKGNRRDERFWLPRSLSPRHSPSLMRSDEHVR